MNWTIQERQGQTHPVLLMDQYGKCIAEVWQRKYKDKLLAAPEMYQALQHTMLIIKTFNELLLRHESDASIVGVMDALFDNPIFDQAIAKAEGVTKKVFDKIPKIDIKELVYKYILLNNTYNKHREELVKLESSCPKAPLIFDSLSEMEEFTEKEKSHNKSIEEIRAMMKKIVDLVKEVKKTIMDQLTVKNVWLRCGDYGVGYYYDTWGGGHYELIVKKWEEKMPELSDRTYYP